MRFSPVKKQTHSRRTRDAAWFTTITTRFTAVTLVTLIGFAAMQVFDGLEASAGEVVEAAGAGGDTPASPARQTPADVGGKQARLRITGMVCQGCVRGITKALTGVNGVKQCTVTLDPPRAAVTYDPEAVTVAKLVETVNQLGYKAEAE